MMHELRFAFRTLHRSPGFTITAVATLALAIGANTAMFSVVDAVLLRPLPYRSPERLAMLWTENPSQELREGRSPYVNVEAWRRQSQTFTDLAVFDPVSVMLTSADAVEKIRGVRVSPNFLPLLGVEPVLGRSFSAEEATGRQRLALISDHFWQTRFAGSPRAIGASIVLDGRPSQIIGVLPPDVEMGITDADVWEPHTLFPDWEARRVSRGPGSWFVVGRMRPDVTLGQAQSEMSAIARRLDGQSPASVRTQGISVVPLGLHLVGARSRLALWMLTGAVSCVLLIAAANVASLSLARSVGRGREMAIRAALGASAGRIVRQLLAESVTLAAIAGLLGALLAGAGVRLIRVVGPRDVARLNEVSVDLRVLGWALAISLLTGILVGVAPAIAMRRRNVRPSGEDGGRGVAGGVTTRRIRRALVTAEFALAIILLAGAGLLVRSWLSLERVDPGFRTARILSVQLSATSVTIPAQRPQFYGRVLAEVAALPGVESAGLIGDLLIGGSPELVLTTEGDTGALTERVRFRRDEVSDRFFTTVGTPLLGGRFFTAGDGPDSPRVAIVNEAMVRRVWPGRDPIGRRFILGARGSGGPSFTVVGVVGDMRRQGLEREPIPQMFEPVAQNPSGLATLLVRTSVEDPLTIAGALRAAVHRVDARAPIYGVTTLDSRLGTFLTERRFQTSLLIGFAGVALLMAAIGIYGLVQYSVATRTHEIGVRMAIGAQSGDIFRMVVREGLTLSLTGLALGLAGALWIGQAGASLLFGVTATDPLTFTAVSLLLTGVATAACCVPARRAMTIAPIIALRQE